MSSISTDSDFRDGQAAANLQGIALARFETPLTPFQVRQLLVETGSPQLGDNPEAEHIGPRPDLREAIEQITEPPVMCDGQIATSVGTPGDDVLIGTAGPDVMHGLGGHDIVSGLGGDDTICGGSGDDTVSGGPGNDTVSGDLGNDIVRGGSGNDTLNGGGGSDTCNGGLNVDIFVNCETAVNVLESPDEPDSEDEEDFEGGV